MNNEEHGLREIALEWGDWHGEDPFKGRVANTRNPFVSQLRLSMQGIDTTQEAWTGHTRQVVVLVTDREKTVHLIRAAADNLHCGYEKTFEMLDDEQCRIYYRARRRVTRPRRRK